ncbi:hypothetical protein [Spirosoma sp. 209]|uniref:hypothetical protein n=1 Tax=Spirosoma sp. 209 TaxID=1955701 RepID=UPI00098D1B79|nr:hypothetical protein [Spirosoma sp. 209]
MQNVLIFPDLCEMSQSEMLVINGGLCSGPKIPWDKLKKGAQTLWNEAKKTCAVNCALSWCEGFVKEMLN